MAAQFVGGGMVLCMSRRQTTSASCQSAVAIHTHARFGLMAVLPAGDPTDVAKRRRRKANVSWQLAVEEPHTCGLRPDGSAVCWGDDYDGLASPPRGERFASISSGGAHTCALWPDGSATCWGSDEDGQSSPPTGGRFASISSGFDYTCALRHDASAVCWGSGVEEGGKGLPPEGGRFASISSGGILFYVRIAYRWQSGLLGHKRVWGSSTSSG